MRRNLLLLLLGLPLLLFAWNDPPVISNVSFENNVGAQLITITYDVSDSEESSVEILFKASFDEGQKFLVNTADATGDVGMGVSVGNERTIQWNYSNYWDNINGKTLRIIADDGFRPNIQDIVNQVDSNRMLDLLAYIAQPRTITTYQTHLYAVRDTLIDLMTANNYEIKLQEFEVSGQVATNVIGRKAGLGDEAQTIVMDAHYDASFNAPGADDNGSGVVGFLEAMFLLSDYQFDKSIEFIGFDQEETGLLGSINYSWLGGIESWKRVEAVLNYEMIGYYSEQPNSQEVPLGLDILLEEQYQELVDDEFRGNFIFMAANDASAFIPELYKDMAAMYVPDLKVVSAVVPLNGLIAPDLLRSDHAPFWFKGIPAVMITDGSEFRNRNYHTSLDVIDSLNFNFMRQVTQAGLASLISLAGMRHADVETFVVEELITATADNSFECKGSWYPNPSKGSVFFNLEHCLPGEQEIQLTLTDVTGRTISEQHVSNNERVLEINPPAPGTYLVILQSTDSQITHVVQIY